MDAASVADGTRFDFRVCLKYYGRNIVNVEICKHGWMCVTLSQNNGCSKFFEIL